MTGQLIRPEFQAFLDHEQKTIAIVTEVANIFDQVTEGPLHTPALYSCFLRALVNARTDGSEPQQQGVSSNGELTSANRPPDPLTQATLAAHTTPARVFGQDAGMENFSYTGEMGPVADISTFPPTMAPHPQGMEMNMLSMDSILSADFWDSVLVPGEFPLPSF